MACAMYALAGRCITTLPHIREGGVRICPTPLVSPTPPPGVSGPRAGHDSRPLNPRYARQPGRPFFVRSAMVPPFVGMAPRCGTHASRVGPCGGEVLARASATLLYHRRATLLARPSSSRSTPSPNVRSSGRASRQRLGRRGSTRSPAWAPSCVRRAGTAPQAS